MKLFWLWLARTAVSHLEGEWQLYNTQDINMYWTPDSPFGRMVTLINDTGDTIRKVLFGK